VSDKILTEEETSALLGGVSSGAIEVHSTEGERYADLRPFEFGPHARIRSNSYPRLKALNQQLASQAEQFCSSTLNCEVEIVPQAPTLRSFSDHCGQLAPVSAVTTFRALPLEGHGLIILEAPAISQLVEAFFGGAQSEAVRNTSGTFTPGEMAVCRLFSNAVLTMMQQTWEPLIDMKPERDSTEVGTDLIDDIGATDLVIGNRFDLNFVDSPAAFSLLLPLNMILPLIPVLDGQKRERDLAEDRRWEKAIRTHLLGARVELEGFVGTAALALRDLTGLEKGCVIDIENPRKATVMAGGVPILSGRFGAHSGRNAIEAEEWLNAKANEIDQRKSEQ
jgi:flagellar motor switch protein FliM